jgi:cytochrome b subunit of formate dehydrogenase
VHDILPSTDADSSIHPDNLGVTCGKCHPGAGTTFAIGPVHVQPRDRQHAAVWWVRSVYLALIWTTIGLMMLHNGADLWRKMRAPVRRASGPPPAAARERMGRGFRVAHQLLIASFAILVYSGFALTYPEAWWARPLLYWESQLALRGTVHRIAAIVLLGTLAGHVVHVARSERARACIRAMVPNRGDLGELRQRVAWLAGRRATPPRAPWIGYPEKAEYWALMWGIAVMSVTGVLLWAEGTVLRWLPTWVIDVSTVIHFYEAVLATLAILVWHLYFVIFDPVVYPMDTAWLTGRSPAGRVEEREEP